MSYSVMVTGTKSTESEWFIDVYPDIQNNYFQWESNHPGVIDISYVHSTDTTIKILMEFDTEESYNLFLVNRENNLDWKIKDEYYNSINAIFEIEVLSN